MPKPLAGMHAALMTAFGDDGAFDPARQRALDACVLRQGLTGLYVGGSTGEQGTMESDEVEAVHAVAAEDAAGTGAVLIAHVGLPSLRESVRLARAAARRGYHALSALPPHSYPFADSEIEAYYRVLADATDLPLIVYEIPIRTGRPLGLDMLLRLLDIPRVAGIKFTSTDLFKMTMLMRRRPEKTVFFGFDEMYAAGAIMGADGGIGSTYNLFGKLYVAIDAAVRAGDVARAQALQTISQEFVEVLLDMGVVPGLKAAFRLRGVEIGDCRAPMTLRGEGNEATITAFLTRPDVAPWLA
jgi:N-acetylneuraminate lyase